MRKGCKWMLPVLPPVLLALLLAARPAGVYSQGGVAATATALTAMQQSIYATQTAAAQPAGVRPAPSAITSTPSARQITVTPAPQATVATTESRPPVSNTAPVAEVLVQGLNLRSGPGVGYAIIGNARLGQKLPVLGQSGGCA